MIRSSALFWPAVWLNAKVRVSIFEYQAPGLLRPFISHIWMSVRMLGLILGFGVAVLSYGFGFGKITRLSLWQTRIFIWIFWDITNPSVNWHKCLIFSLRRVWHQRWVMRSTIWSFTTIWRIAALPKTRSRKHNIYFLGWVCSDSVLRVRKHSI